MVLGSGDASSDDERSLLAPGAKSARASPAPDSARSVVLPPSRLHSPALHASPRPTGSPALSVTSQGSKKRGRPFGSKDKTQRKSKKRNVQSNGAANGTASGAANGTAMLCVANGTASGAANPRKRRLFDNADPESQQDLLDFDGCESNSRMSEGRAEGDKGDGDETQRPQMRALTPTPRVGLWDVPALQCLHGRPLPWHLQQHVHARTNAWTSCVLPQDSVPTMREKLPPSGPFDKDSLIHFLKREQLKFAQAFSVPFDIEEVLDMQRDTSLFSSLSTHDAEASVKFMQERMASSRVLFAAQHTHGLVKLDHSSIAHIQHVDIAQFEEARASRVRRMGPQGGCAGCKRHCFFWITGEEAAMTTPDELLELMTLLCCLMQPDANKRLHQDFYPGVNTEYTELQVRESVIRAVRMSTPGDLTVMQKHEVDGVEVDIDPQILHSIQQARGALTDPPQELCAAQCVPPCKNINDANKAGQQLPEDSDMPTKQTHSELFDVTLGLSVHRCVDQHGNMRRVKLNTLSVQEKVVGMEFVVFLRQALRAGELHDRLSIKLMEVLRHMSALLHQTTSIDLGALLDTPTEKVHIIDLICEDNVQLAMMRYAKREKLLALSFGGQIFHMHDKERRRLFCRYLEEVNRARRQALEQVSVVVGAQDCNSYSSMKCRRLPMKEFALDGEVAFHYRSMPRESVIEAIEQHKQELLACQNFVDDQEAQMWVDSFYSKWNPWVASQLQDEHDGGNVYFAVQGAMCNYGIQVVMNIGAFNVIRTNRHEISIDKFPQPILVMPAIKIYLHNALKGTDPYEAFLDGSIPVDFGTLEANKHLAGELLTLRQALRPVSSDDMRGLSLRSMQQQQEMILLGKHVPDVQINIESLVQYVNLAEACVMLRDTFKYGLIEILDEARKSDLVQWKYTAAAVSELAEQGRQHMDAYTWDKTKAWRRVSTAWDDGVWVNTWLEEQTAAADLKLAWKPHMVVRTLQMFHAAVFGRINNDAMWGATVSFSDMGNSMTVLGSSKAGYSRKREEVLYDRKTPSCGADMCHTVSVNMEVAYNSMLSTDKTVRGFFKSNDSAEYYTLHVSGQKATTWLGHGCKKDGNGNILDGQWKQLIGTAGVMNELLKVNASSAQDALSNIESALPHSSTNGHIQEQGADTNMDGKGISTENIIHMPLKSKASNRFNRHTPKSLLAGGRQKSIMSPVQDGAIGVMTNSLPGLPQVQAGGTQQAVSRAVHTLRTCPWHSAPAKEKQTVGDISADKAKVLRPFLLFHAMNRRMVVFFHRSMSIGWRLPSYTFGMDKEALMTKFLHMTHGIRRSFFSDSNNETWQRTFEGSFWTATAFPVWMQQNIARCLLYHMTRARASISMELSMEENMNISNTTSVQLKQAHEDALFGMQRHVVTFVAMASAMYMWLATCVIDAAVMVMCCYQLQMMGFAAPCPLHVLVLAMNGKEMSESEYGQYKRFCSFILPLVSNAGRGGFAHNMPQPATVPPSKDDLEAWLRMSSDTQRRYMAWRSRTGQDGNVRNAGVYVTPSMQFVTTDTPDWIQVDTGNDRSKPKQKEEDRHVTASVRLKMADLFAQHQTEAAHDTRTANSRVYGVLDFQNTTAFWNAARKGVRWPRCEASDSDKAFDFSFDDPETTGWFWEKTMGNVQSMQGLLVPFLQWCGCTEKTSRYDFFCKLLEPFKERERMCFDVHKVGQWQVPILHRKSSGEKPSVRLKAFEWACWPQFEMPPMPAMGGAGMSAQRTPTQTGVAIALGLDVLQIVIAQIFCKEWKQTSDIRTQSVVHLRNLGHAAQELIGMWVHTGVQESLLPVGPLRLHAPCPMSFATGHGGGNAVEIPVRPEIHFNRMTFRHTPASDEPSSQCNVLEHSFRLRHGFCTVSLRGVAGETEESVFYKGSSDRLELLPPHNFAGFPFPPESVAHMLTHFEFLHWWVALYRQQRADRCSPFVLDIGNVVQEAGKMMSGGALGVVPLTLTLGICSQKREIPFVSFQHNRMFVVKLSQDMQRVRLYGVEATHKSEDEWMQGCQWQPLVMRNQDVSPMLLSPQELHMFMIDGLWYDADEQEVLNSSNHWWKEQSSRSVHRLPFMPFPAVVWDQVVLLTETGPMLRTCIENDEHDHVRIVSADDLYEKWDLLDATVTPFCVKVLTSYGIDLIHMAADGWKIDMLALFIEHESEEQAGPVWMSRGEGADLMRLYFNSVLELCHAVRSGRGDVLRDPARANWVHQEVLVARVREYDMFCEWSYHYAFLTFDPQYETMEATFYAYDDTDFVAVQTEIACKQQRFESQQATLEQRTRALKHTQTALLLTNEKPEYNDSILQMQAQVDETRVICEATQAELNALVVKLETLKPKQSVELSLTMADKNTTEELHDVSLMRPVSGNLSTNTDQFKRSVFGIIKSWDRHGHYLSNGRYKVEYLDPECGAGMYVELDFVSAARCLLPECTTLFMLLDQELCEALLCLESDLTVPHARFKAGALTGKLALRCYYVLGGTPSTVLEKAHNAVVRLLVPVKQMFENEYTFTGDSMKDYIAVFCRIYDNNKKPQLFLAPPCADDNIVDYLVRSPDSYVTSAEGASSSRVWHCDEMRL